MLKRGQIRRHIVDPQLLPQRLPTKCVITETRVGFISTCWLQERERDDLTKSRSLHRTPQVLNGGWRMERPANKTGVPGQVTW